MHEGGFTVAEKYPERESEPEPIDAVEILAKNQTRGVSFFPLSRIKRRRIERLKIRPPILDFPAALQTGTPALFKPPGFEKEYIHSFFEEKKSHIKPVTGGTVSASKMPFVGTSMEGGPAGIKMGLLDRFFAWINRLLERKP